MRSPPTQGTGSVSSPASSGVSSGQPVDGRRVTACPSWCAEPDSERHGIGWHEGGPVEPLQVHLHNGQTVEMLGANLFTSPLVDDGETLALVDLDEGQRGVLDLTGVRILVDELREHADKLDRMIADADVTSTSNHAPQAAER